MKRPQVIGIGVVLALAAGTVGLVVRAHVADTPAACAVPTAAPDKPHDAAAKASDGGGLRVVEQGFTNLNSGVSYGAIVENTSTSIAYRTRVTYRFSSRGKPVEQPPSPLNAQEIPIIWPGQRIGVAITSVLLSPHSATTVEVRLGDTTWLSQDEASHDISPVTTTVVHTEHPNDQYLGYLKITYTNATAPCRQLAGRGVVTVVRNQSGTIIGGTLQGSDDGCSPGTHTTSPISLLPVPDDTRTQIFPYCDLQLPAESVTRPIAN
jgi:hypothetical protein